MTWQVQPVVDNLDADEPEILRTELIWDGEKRGEIDGEIDSWINGYPAGEVRDEIKQIYQTADHPTTILMQHDMNYGVERLPPK